MIRHVAGIAEVVGDFTAAVKYYIDVLGLSVERRAAAEATFGDPEATDRISLGFTAGFEVDDVEETTQSMSAAGTVFAHAPREEPWKQVTSRFMSTSGALCELSDTPWARRITQQMRASEE